MFSHFFPLYFLFSIVPFSITTATTTTVSAIQQRERETCLLNSALSLSLALFFCFTLFRARSPSRSLSSHTQLCWLSENIKNARETFCSKLLTTFIISMCGCVCVCSNCLSTNCICCTLIKQCRHTLNSFFFHIDTLLIFFLFHKTQTTLDTLCRQANRV